MVGAVVGSFEANVDAVAGRLHLLQHVVQEGACPAGGRDGVVTPRLTGRQRSHLEPSVAGALEGDGPLHCRQGAEVVERQGGGMLDGAADFECAAVVGQRRSCCARSGTRSE